MKSERKIIAVDFDGRLVTNKYPEVGDLIEKNIKKLKEELAAGAKVCYAAASNWHRYIGELRYERYGWLTLMAAMVATMAAARLAFN